MVMILRDSNIFDTEIKGISGAKSQWRNYDQYNEHTAYLQPSNSNSR